MRQNNTDAPAAIFQGLFDTGFDFLGWLLIRPPAPAFHAPCLVDAVCTADSNGLLSIQVIDFAILGEQDIGIPVLCENLTAMPFPLVVHIKTFRTTLMVSVNAEEGNR